MKTPMLLAALAITLSSCASNKVDPEIELLKRENKDLEEKVNALEQKNSVLSSRIREENSRFYAATMPELDEGGWQKLDGGLEVYARTFPFRDGEFSVVRMDKTRLFFGKVKKQDKDRVVLGNWPFAVGGSGTLLGGNSISMLSKLGTVQVTSDGEENWEGALETLLLRR